jgi:thiol:disulfide interchange protein
MEAQADMRTEKSALATTGLLACIFLVAATPSLVLAGDLPPPPEVQRFDPARDPEADLAAAMQTAAASGKRILLEVGGNWCPWTRRLDGLLETDAAITAALAAGYVQLRVHRSKDQPNEAFLARFPKVPGVPHLFVLDAQGKLLHSQDTGALEAGDRHDPAKVLAFLRVWSPPATSR